MSNAAPTLTSSAPVMVLAGGTGGHIFPALAVAKVLRARGVPVTWLGADGAMETRLVPPHGIPLDTLAIAGLRGKGKLTLLGAPLRVARAVMSAVGVLRARKPRAVISFGGFAAGPGGMAARLLGTPLLVHEQNRAPGLTNRVLVRFSRRVLTGFPAASRSARSTWAIRCAKKSPPLHRRHSAWPGAKVRCVCWCWVAARAHVH